MIRRFFCCCLLLFPAIAHAWVHDPAPLHYRNQHPLYLQLPNITPRSAVALTAGAGRWSMTQQYSNIFERAIDATFDTRIDLEQLRTDFTFLQGLGHGMTAELNVPLYYTSGGFLDPFLNWYHRTLGVPNAGRDNFPNNQFVYRITNTTTATDVVNVSATGFGLGDASLSLSHEVIPRRAGRPGLTWFGVAEFPTGSTSRGLGNGAFDFGLGAMSEIASDRWYGFADLGYFVSGGHTGALEDFLQDTYLSYVLGGAFRLSRRLSLNAQIHGGTPQLQGIAHRQWTDMPLDIVFGLTGDYPEALGDDTLFWQLAFSEDLHANGPSIDFTAIGQFGIRWKGL